MAIANTFFNAPEDERVTYRDLGVAPMDPICPELFSQIDHILCNSSVLPWVLDCRSHRRAALNSHHFLTTANIAFQFQNRNIARPPRSDVSSLKEPGVRRDFVSKFTLAWGDAVLGGSLDDVAGAVEQAFSSAACSLKPRHTVAKRPWISQRTLDLIEKRNTCRTTGRSIEEQALNKEIRQAARQDRSNWINTAL
eukprot:8872786-Pyramimonas_sp.AAC.1